MTWLIDRHGVEGARTERAVCRVTEDGGETTCKSEPGRKHPMPGTTAKHQSFSSPQPSPMAVKSITAGYRATKTEGWLVAMWKLRRPLDRATGIS
jgi:hypothetical protein